VKQVVYGGDGFFIPWICERVGSSPENSRGVTIGLWDTETDLPLAGVLFEDFNGASILAHIAAVPGKSWLSRTFLRHIFAYPFHQLSCRVVLLTIAEDNLESRRFAKGLGFTLAATLLDAHPSGALLIYRMARADCRWLKGLEHGKS
jgi:RimJ/RimL family protein N-acetyltransferase